MDFATSDSEARGMLACAAFDLLETMRQRGLPLAGPVEGVLGFVSILAAELQQLSVPIDFMGELHIGKI